MLRLLPRILCLLVSFALVSCATSGSRYPAQSAPAPSKPVFAVQLFSTPSSKAVSENDRGLREFEQFYHPAKIVDALNATGSASAYYTLTNSPAADFNVEGKILFSNGKKLSMEILATRVDGTVVLKRAFNVDHEDARERVIATKMNSFYADIASNLRAAATKSPVDLMEARTRAYANNPALDVSPKRKENAGIATQIERGDILLPMTKAVIPRARIADKLYVEWLEVSIPLQKDKTLNSYHQGFSVTGTAVGTVYMGAALTQGAAASAQGNQALSSQSLTKAAAGGRLMVDGVAGAQAAAHRIKEIRKALEAFNKEFLTGTPRQVTVRIYGKILGLAGSQEAMLEEFHRAVKEELTKG